MDPHISNIVATAATDAIRTETFQGRDYTVVPVIALVEGVLHSANAQNPELALASEFGRYPQSWNGRPLVMNHPKVGGENVSANIPNVLEEWSFGQIFNAEVTNDKLKVEAWIDNAKVADLGGETAETLDRINSGETVEVSVGLYATVQPTHGRFNGQAFEGIWQSVAPDHLAFLSEGTIGACSIEDGCGVPRLNLMNYAAKRTADAPVIEMDETSEVVAESDCGCGCGGTGACGNKGVNLQSVTVAPTATAATVTNAGSITRIQKHTKGKGMFGMLSNLMGTSSQKALQRMSTDQRTVLRFNEIMVASIPEGMPIETLRPLLARALEDADVDLWTIHTFTTDRVIYEAWESTKVFSRSFSITEEGDSITVSLGDDIQEVAIIPKIVMVNEGGASEDSGAQSLAPGSPQTTAEPSQGPPSNSSEDTPPTDTTTTAEADSTETQEGTMNPEDELNDTGQTTGENIEDDVTSTPAPAAPTEPLAANTGDDAESFTTAEEYIAAAPPEMQEVLRDGLRLQNERKSAIVGALKANERCDYSEDELKAMSLADLERLSKLANVPTYVGQAPARQLQVNGGNEVPAPIEAFPTKKSA